MDKMKFVALLLVLSLVLFFGGLLWWRIYPSVQIVDESLAAYNELTIQSTQSSVGGVVSGENVQGSVDVQITGTGTILLDKVTVTLGGNEIWMVDAHTSGLVEVNAFGRTLQLPVPLTVDVLREDWAGPTTSSSAPLIVTFYGSWSPTGGTPTYPVTLTEQETVQWMVAWSTP
jgi:hypothetical protein